MHRRVALLVLALCLAACGDRTSRAPFTNSRLPPGLSQTDWPPHGWTWGLIQVGGDPAQRYGVGAAATVPRAEVLILPGYGDFAETHFAEAGGLIGTGDTVWILDGSGQGGSGRDAGPRDLGHLKSFDADIQALGAMTQMVIRPGPDAPFFLIAEGSAAPVALSVLQQGKVRPAGLILVDPLLHSPAADLDQAHWASRLLLGAIRAPGGDGWKRDQQPKDPGDRRRHDWQLANPDLRMGGPSLGWLAAFDDLVQKVAAAGPAKVGAPVLIISTGRGDARSEERLCRALPHCTLQSTNAAHPLTSIEAAFFQGLMPANGLAPWSSPIRGDDGGQAPSTPFDVPR